MKTVQFLDQAGTWILSDLLNQRILRELVMGEYAATELVKRLDVPILRLWRRMQKLESAGLIEVSIVQKAANIEKKHYRATATSFVPRQFLDFMPKDERLAQAFEIYSAIHKRIVARVAGSHEIPRGANPTDCSLYVSMNAFAEVCGDPNFGGFISELSDRLSEFKIAAETPAR